jgi:uncharacterized protein (DUF58 family)
MDFEETREYSPGDDVRAIDWNVTARMDRPFVKVFREERELTMLLAVDLSASQDFGSVEKSKREVAAELASILALSALRNGDKVGLLLFTDRVETYIAPRKGMQHVLRVVREILFHQPQGRGTDRPAALDYVNHVTKRRATVFLISDFSSGAAPAANDHAARLLAVTSARHDLVAVDLGDQREGELPDVGVVLLEDPETGRRVEVDTADARLRRRFMDVATADHREWRSLLSRINAGYMPLGTEKDVVQSLRIFMEGRARAR